MLRVTPSYLPSDGDAATAAVVHRIVDEATVEVPSALLVGASDIMVVTTYTAAYPSLQSLGEAVSAFFHSAVSAIGSAVELGPGRGVLSVWPTVASLPAGTVIPKGWPVYISRSAQVNADRIGDVGTLIAAMFRLPQVQCDPRCVYPHHATSTIGIAANDQFFLTKAAVAANPAMVPLLYAGMGEALVHYSLSSSFSPNDLLALYHSSGLGIYTRIPVSWHGSNNSGATLNHVPYGVIRQVFTDSGVTMISMPRESTAYSLAAQPFLVAQVWFWGQPCL